jgi:hypothetical protein
MASSSALIPMPQTKASARLRLAAQAPTLRIAFILFVVLLILFGWLHLILAMHIASTTRLIHQQEKVQDKLDRDKAALLQQIAEAESPRNMETRLEAAGYVREEPLFLGASSPITMEADDDISLGSSSSASATSTETSSSISGSLLDSVLGELGTWSETEQ